MLEVELKETGELAEVLASAGMELQALAWQLKTQMDKAWSPISPLRRWCCAA